MTVNYEINKSDGSVFVTVPQGTAVEQAGLTLIGKNYVAFGEALNENIVHLAENFAATSGPSGPLTGQLWYDKTNKTLKVYSGSQYNGLVTGSFQNSQPTSPAENQLWFDTSDRRLYVYSGGTFRLIGPTGLADTQVIGDTIIDTVGDPHKVIRILVNNKNVAIITEDTFIPAAAQVGFTSIPAPTLAPGINIGNDTTWDFKLRGLATVSETLKDGASTLSASNIIRNNTNGVIAGTLNADNGLSVGSSSQIQLYPQSNNFRISNTVNGGNIYLQTTDGTGLQSTVTVTTGQEVGINTTSPGATLDVVGTFRASGNATFLGIATGLKSTNTTSPGNSEFTTTSWVWDRFNNTVLTGTPTATGALSTSDNSTRIATTAYVKAQFDNTVLTGVPTAPNISNLVQSDQQIANTKFVQDVITGTLSTKAEQSALDAVDTRVLAIEGDYARLTGNNGVGAFSGTHDFTSATVTVAAPAANSQPTTKLYVDYALALKANVASPIFTGVPEAPTPLSSDDSTKIATTEWVNDAIIAAGTLGIAGVTVQDEGVTQGTSAGITTINFTGGDVSVTGAGSTATVTVNAVSGQLPIGSIIMWYGTEASLDPNWHICDGTMGTPDLRNKFVMGASSDYSAPATTPGEVRYEGGSLTAITTTSAGSHNHGAATGGTTLSATDIPTHSHTLYVDGSADTDNLSYGFSYASNIAVAGKSITGGAGAYRSVNGQSTALISGTNTPTPHTHTISSDGTHTHTVTPTLPPYYTLYFIMKIA